MSVSPYEKLELSLYARSIAPRNTCLCVVVANNSFIQSKLYNLMCLARTCNTELCIHMYEEEGRGVKELLGGGDIMKS